MHLQYHRSVSIRGGDHWIAMALALEGPRLGKRLEQHFLMTLEMFCG